MTLAMVTHSIPGSDMPCTEEALRRLARIAVPVVRRMVARKVVEVARAERAAVVDVALLERAASF